MRTSIILRLVVATVFSLLFTSPTSADSSKDCARMARAMWSSFECSCLAEKIGNTEEQARLFQFGYDQGQKFIAALKSNKITKEDLGSEVPIGVLLRLEGPTPDFMLGRIFQATAESAFEDVFKSGDHFSSEEDQRLAAENKFRKANCQLLGRKK